MILRVNRMIHVFRLHRKGREIAEFSPDTRLRMAGALNKQGRLLYFYGLGGGSGDGARVFGGGGRDISMRYLGGKKAPFSELKRKFQRGIALASNNNNHDEYKFEVRGNVEFETQSKQGTWSTW